jgi:hypothetical protein
MIDVTVRTDRLALRNPERSYPASPTIASVLMNDLFLLLTPRLSLVATERQMVLFPNSANSWQHQVPRG